MHRPLVRPLVRGLVRSITGSVQTIVSTVKRWMYNFDGVDDRGTFLAKAINVDSDIDVQWEQTGVPSTSIRTIVSQCSSATFNQREFSLRFDAGKLTLVVGGSLLISGTDNLNSADGKWRVFVSGTSVRAFFNDAQVLNVVRARGAAREPSAVTLIGVRDNAGGFVEFVSGNLRNIRFGGVMYPIEAQNQSIQLPIPSGLGTELITQAIMESPNTANNEWTYLGDRTWQLQGTGGYNALQFLQLAALPNAMYVEFEVLSITGTLRISTNANVIGDRTFNTTGVKRVYFTTKPNDFIFVRNNTGESVNAVIKNISFKSMVSTTSYLGNLSGNWTVLEGTVGTNTSTVISIAGTPNASAKRTLPTGLVPDVPVTVTFNSSVAGGAFSFRSNSSITVSTTIVSGANTLTFTPTAAQLTDHFFGVERVGGNIGVTITGISSEALSTNLLRLSNTTPERWTEVDGVVPKSRFVYNFDGVDDRAVLFNRAINVDQDIDIEWRSGSNIGAGTARAIVGQTLTTTGSNQEFALFINSGGGFVFRVGGTETGFVGFTYQANTLYRVTFVGGTATLYINGVSSNTRAFTRGAAREPTAVTTVGTLATAFHYLGTLQDVKINGSLWPMSDFNRTVQLPEPTGLGAALPWTTAGFVVPSGFDNTLQEQTTSSFSTVKGTTASRVAASFSTASESNYVVEFDVQYLQTGAQLAVFLRDGSTAGNGTVIQTIALLPSGKTRMLFSRISVAANILFVSNAAADYKVSDVRVYPQGSSNPMTLVNTTTDRWIEVLA